MSNFTNTKIKDTYQRVLQIDNGEIQDGLGLPVDARIQSLESDLGFTGDLDGTATLAIGLTSGDKTIQGNLDVIGKITAIEIYAQYESSSIIFSSGSTKFGDSFDDTHQFTGSVSITGSSFLYNGYNVITSNDTGSIVVDSASYATFAATASYLLGSVDSASYAQTASYIQLSGVDGFTSYSSSVSSSISALSSSFISFSASYNTGSFTGSFTGNLQGTSSWATNAQTASLAPNYVLTSVTSSMLQPYVLTSQTSSMSVASASVATSASYALTASFALNGGGGTTNTGSLLTTASVNLNTITFTKGDGSTFPITVDTGSGGGGGAAFPYTGSAIISGSLEVTGSTNLNGTFNLNTNPSTASLGPGLTTNLLSISSSQVNFDFDELEGDFDLIQTGSQSITGAVTASYFKGDGTEISGISAINWFLS